MLLTSKNGIAHATEYNRNPMKIEDSVNLKELIPNDKLRSIVRCINLFSTTFEVMRFDDVTIDDKTRTVRHRVIADTSLFNDDECAYVGGSGVEDGNYILNIKTVLEDSKYDPEINFKTLTEAMKLVFPNVISVELGIVHSGGPYSDRGEDPRDYMIKIKYAKHDSIYDKSYTDKIVNKSAFKETVECDYKTILKENSSSKIAIYIAKCIVGDIINHVNGGVNRGVICEQYTHECEFHNICIPPNDELFKNYRLIQEIPPNGTTRDIKCKTIPDLFTALGSKYLIRYEETDDLFEVNRLLGCIPGLEGSYIRICPNRPHMNMIKVVVPVKESVEQ
ncbi:MAG: hypothetical protein ACRC5M_06875 [Anaeroplasmataceae bacterium]